MADNFLNESVRWRVAWRCVRVVRRADPFVYLLPEQEAVWRNDPKWVEEERRRETRNWIEESFGTSQTESAGGSAEQYGGEPTA